MKTRYLVTVRVDGWLSPPLLQPRSPARLGGVCTTIWAVPGDGIWVVVIVVCSRVLLMTFVARAAPFHMMTDSE